MSHALPIAVNFSCEARALFAANEIAFDLWKCTPPGELGGVENVLGNGHPAYVHFPFDAGRPELLGTDWDAVERLLDVTGTPHVNVHLNAHRKQFEGVAEADRTEAVRGRFLRALEAMVARFGPERVVAENVVYRGEGGAFLRASVEPETIKAVVEASGCRLLLDLAHATLSCDALGIVDPRGYIEALPVHLLAELHVTGVGPDEGGRPRDSMPMTERDWTLAEWTVGKVEHSVWPSPRMVALEYGGIGPIFDWRNEPSVIRTELARLGAMVDGVSDPA